MEKFQSRACLVVTAGIQGASREQLYYELNLYSLVKTRWCSKLVFLKKTVYRLLLHYVYSDLDFSSQENYLLRSSSTSIYKTSSNKDKIIKKNIFPMFPKVKSLFYFMFLK